MVRLRQAVLVAADLEATAVAAARGISASRSRFAIPGSGCSGSQNVVFAIGDCFIEVVSPSTEGTAAGRQLERRGGDGGYMVLFDIEDLDGARTRAEQMGVRTVWSIDLPDISGTHMHPADLRGAIVSLDSSRPSGAGAGAGLSGPGASAAGPPGRLSGITVALSEPGPVAERWAQVLGVPLDGRRSPGSRWMEPRCDSSQLTAPRASSRSQSRCRRRCGRARGDRGRLGGDRALVAGAG